MYPKSQSRRTVRSIYMVRWILRLYESANRQVKLFFRFRCMWIKVFMFKLCNSEAGLTSQVQKIHHKFYRLSIRNSSATVFCLLWYGKKLDRSSLHCVVEENKDLNQPTREVVMFVDKCLIWVIFCLIRVIDSNERTIFQHETVQLIQKCRVLNEISFV